MKIGRRQKGFTLIEILVASAIILSILSMVYGTYFAISKSTEATKANMALFQQGRTILNQLARQIRCSYADTHNDPTYTTGLSSKQTREIPQSSPDYFTCRPDGRNGEILHLVTTKGFDWSQESSEGLFEVTYRFDEDKGRLYLSQKRFTGATEKNAEKRIWQPIAEDVESITFRFLDGGQWLNNWSFKDRKKLPSAVKIDISIRDQIHQTHNFSTVVHVCCRKDYGQENQFGKLVTAKDK